MSVKHYRPDKIEAIEVIEAWQLDFNLGNVVKYICRAGLKTDDSKEDLQKAFNYLYREIYGKWPANGQGAVND